MAWRRIVITQKSDPKWGKWGSKNGPLPRKAKRELEKKYDSRSTAAYPAARQSPRSLFDDSRKGIRGQRLVLVVLGVPVVDIWVGELDNSGSGNGVSVREGLGLGDDNVDGSGELGL